MVDTVFALTIVLGAIFALRFALRASGLDRAGAGGAAIRIRASRALGPRQRLHVVEVDGQRLLLASTDQSIRLLRSLPAAEAPEVAEAERQDPDAAPVRRWVARLWRPTATLALALAAGLAIPGEAGAQGAAAGGASALLPLDLGAVTGPDRISTTLEIVALLTLISVAPSVLLMATCFTRVVIVLALLRQALGVQQLPPNQVLVGLALAITLFVMAPLGQRIQEEALDPYVARTLDAPAAAERASGAVREFLLRYTREKDLALFVSISGSEPPESREAVALWVLLPAYMISELRTAFEIGFTLFLPFLIVDLVIASMLISMQMIVLPPIVISLPFKLMLFVLVDGWNLLVGSLVRSLG